MKPSPCTTASEQAAAWIVRLSSDDAEERRQAEQSFLAWKAADPRHAEAAARLEKLVGQLAAFRQDGSRSPARQAILAARQSTPRPARRLAARLALLAALLLPGWLALQTTPASSLLADLHTGSGEWQSTTLADGSRLALGGSAAVDLQFDAKTRTVTLLRGQILVDVAHDGRPFIVATPHGSIRALGTRFLVNRYADETVLEMLESRVAVSVVGSDRPIVVEAGQSLRFAADGGARLASIDGPLLEDAWRQRQLVVRDRPLDEVLEQLARNRSGLIRYDREAVASLHVSAVLPLNDTDRALQLLANNFPALRIRRFSPYFVTVDRAEVR